ncbi:nucleoside triphosphate pyrophosphohydrolase [Streptomyces sp. NPDC127190]|uniref:nucleoside triphosphate pyrophosphohydrolase n=1 Tax=unclassified Streptomyces TaxID=2593676 RepID=UPI00362A6F30
MEPYSRHGTLVRDRFPQVIREDGAEPVTYTAGREEYRSRLRDKLGEEVAEFPEADEDSAPEELADVLEVVRALAADLGVDADQLEKIREAKAGERCFPLFRLRSGYGASRQAALGRWARRTPVPGRIGGRQGSRRGVRPPRRDSRRPADYR